jgi:hypothetical protein
MSHASHESAESRHMRHWRAAGFTGGAARNAGSPAKKNRHTLCWWLLVGDV